MARFRSNFGLGLRVGHGWYPAAVVASLLLLLLLNLSQAVVDPPVSCSAFAGQSRSPLLSLSHGFGWDFACARRLQFAHHRHLSGCPHPSPSPSQLAVASPLSRSAGFRGLGFLGVRVSGLSERRGKRWGVGQWGRANWEPPLPFLPLISFSFFFLYLAHLLLT